MNTKYPIELEANDGGYTVTFPGLPFGITEGDNLAEALENAEDALVVVITTLIEDGEEVPEPLEGDYAYRVALPEDVALKVAFYRAFRALGWTKAELGRRLSWSNTQVARLFNARHGTRFNALIDALRVVGKRVVSYDIEDVPTITEKKAAKRRAETPS